MISSSTTGRRDLGVARVRLARNFAWGGWALVSISTGIALALVQYASLIDGDPQRLNVAATVIAIGGTGPALLSWLWWVIVHVFVRPEVDEPCPTAMDHVGGFFMFCLWIFLAVGGAIVMAVGGNADSSALPALLALGGGCACSVAGFLGLMRSIGQMFCSERQEDRRIRASVQAAAAAQGRALNAPSGAATALSLIAFLLFATPMIGCYAIGPWLASVLHVAAPVVEAGIIGLGILGCFPTLAFFIRAHTVTHENVGAQEARVYSYQSAAVATAGIAAIGVLPLLHLGFLSIVVFIGLAVVAGRLRQRHLSQV